MARDAEVRRLRSAGWTVRRIGHEVGLSRTRVGQIAAGVLTPHELRARAEAQAERARIAAYRVTPEERKERAREAMRAVFDAYPPQPQWNGGCSDHNHRSKEASVACRVNGGFGGRVIEVREPIVRAVVWDRDEGTCGICKEPAHPDDWHLDHVIPVAAGGWTGYDNVQVAHPYCNLSKGARVP